MRMFSYSPTILITMLLTLSACASYQVSLNEQIVYQPPVLLSNYDIPDPALKACVSAAIKEQSITEAEQLKQLVCPPGEIQTLNGLEVFEKLETLGLEGNQIIHIATLGLLAALNTLNLKDNQINDISALSALSSIQLLNVKGNSSLSCAAVRGLGLKAENTVILCD